MTQFRSFLTEASGDVIFRDLRDMAGPTMTLGTFKKITTNVLTPYGKVIQEKMGSGYYDAIVQIGRSAIVIHYGKSKNSTDSHVVANINENNTDEYPTRIDKKTYYSNEDYYNRGNRNVRYPDKHEDGDIINESFIAVLETAVREAAADIEKLTR